MEFSQQSLICCSPARIWISTRIHWHPLLNLKAYPVVQSPLQRMNFPCQLRYQEKTLWRQLRPLSCTNPVQIPCRDLLHKRYFRQRGDHLPRENPAKWQVSIPRVPFRRTELWETNALQELLNEFELLG